MANYKTSISEVIGNTPLLLASRYAKKTGACANIFVKLECMNPAGSAKDRAALYMIYDAEKKGSLKKGGVIIEPTSGNTGIGLAAVCASRGYKVILTMPDTMSKERQDMLRAYGAEIILTEGVLGMSGSVAKANELCKTIPNSIMLGQFENPANAYAHYMTTGPEIYSALGGKIDAFVAGVGTGGTISGIGKYLKEQDPDIRIIAVEPLESPLLSKGYAGGHKIQGIGANFIPSLLDKTIYDEVVTVKGDDAMVEGKTFAHSEGIIVGISSGAALKAAKELSLRCDFKGKNIAVLLPDSGDRYLSSEMFK